MCSYGCNRIFCYEVLYVKNPNRFTSVIVPKLLHDEMLSDIIFATFDMSETNTAYAIDAFRKVVCFSGICKKCSKDSKKVLKCLSKFNAQFMRNRNTNKTCNGYFKKKTTCKLRNTPKVSILISDNKKFKMEVKQLIEHSNKQQDKNRKYNYFNKRYIKRDFNPP